MRLNFNVPGEPEERRVGMWRRERPSVVVRRDERGIGQLVRIGRFPGNSSFAAGKV